jgi:hypothetical protein
MPLPQLISRSAFFHALIVITLLGVTLPGAYASRPQLVCNPHSLWLGKVVSGQSQTLPVTLTNNGSSSVTVSSVSVSNAAFVVNNFTVPQTLAAGQVIDFSVTFTPAGIGNVNGTVTFTSNASNNPLNLQVAGQGVNNWGLQANPASLAFGSVLLGSSSTLPLTVVNSGSTSETISLGQVGGVGYSVSGVTLPLTLEAGQSFTFSVTFAPKAAGSSIGNILATSPSSPALNVPLSGTGAAPAGQLSVSPTTINFGNVTVGQSSNQTGQLTASGASVTVSSATMSNAAYALSGMSLPVTLAVGQSVSYTITFNPPSNGVVNGTLSFASNATNSPTVESLSGTGIPAQYSVNLSWQSSSSQVVGYNVYRGSQSGGPYTRINPALDTNTAYTDSSVAAGQTYYYATTAVNSEGQESNYSNLAEAVIP